MTGIDTQRANKILTTDFASEIEHIPEIPGNNVLGFGYDIFDLYADPRSATAQLFDLPVETYLENVGNKVYKVPLAVTVHRLASGSRSLTIGDTIQEFQELLSLDMGLSGSYGFFSGSIESHFSSAVVHQSEWQFVALEDSTQSWLLELPLVDDLRQYLKPTFKQDLLNADSKALFDKYGTHFVREAIIGGKCTFSCYVSRTHQINRTDMELEVKAGYTSLTGSVNFQTGTGLSTDYRTFARTYNARLNVKGGSPAAAFELADGNIPGGFSQWAATVDNDPVLVDFTRKSLYGIWELCEDPARRAQLLDYYQNTVLPGKKPIIPITTKIELEGKYITDMVFIVNDQGSGAKLNGEFFAPNLDMHFGYRSLGHYAQGGSRYVYGTRPYGTILIARETDSSVEKPALKQPVAFAPVWDDRGSGGRRPINIWRPVPPDGYVALGFVVTAESDRLKPPPMDTAYCVRADLVDSATFGDLIWDDREAGTDGNVSIYEINPNLANAKPTGLFWAQPTVSLPATGEAWCPLTSAMKLT